MKNLEYIIVGCGLSGITFCEQLRANQKSFIVFDNNSQQSSTVAAGLYNPVILKRFTEVWKANEQLTLALPKYKELESLLQVKLDYKLPVYRVFASIEEQNDWFTSADKPKLEPYLSTQLIKNDNAFINAPFGFGEVKQTGRLDTEALVSAYRNYLTQEELLLMEPFNYSELNLKSDLVIYKNISAKHIIFAEGFGVTQNPLFKKLPLNVAKGEIIIIKAPQLHIDYILKSSIFITPLQDDLYIVGATYNWDDQTNAITNEGKEELISKLKKVITCEFNVVKQLAGIRPTVRDRRPLVGQHPNYKNAYVLNGLGTRGVMIAPYIAKQLFNFIEFQKPIESEINCSRFVF